MLLLIEEGANTRSFIFQPDYRIILGQSIIQSIDFSGNTCAQRDVCVTYLLRKGLWQDQCTLCWATLLKCSFSSAYNCLQLPESSYSELNSSRWFPFETDFMHVGSRGNQFSHLKSGLAFLSVCWLQLFQECFLSQVVFSQRSALQGVRTLFPNTCTTEHIIAI